MTYVADNKGVVRKKYFEEDYRQRQTLAGLLARDYQVTPGASGDAVQAKHGKLQLY